MEAETISDIYNFEKELLESINRLFRNYWIRAEYVTLKEKLGKERSAGKAKRAREILSEKYFLSVDSIREIVYSKYE